MKTLESVDVKTGGTCSSHGALRVKKNENTNDFMDSTQASYVICCFFRKWTQEATNQELENDCVAISIRRDTRDTYP
jgi:hypothetical protein